MKLKIQNANLSDVGKKRAANEDYHGFFEIQGIKIFIVSDGMGGYKGGATASHIAVNVFRDYFEQNYNKFDSISELIKAAFMQADLKIKQKADEDPDLKNMGATAVLLVLKDDLAYIAHIGDSRAYLIREEEIFRITKDHSLVQQMVDGGIITEEQAKRHPNRNIITHSLGYGGKSDVEIKGPFQLYRNDICILCTDGLTGHVDDEEIKEIALSNEPVTAVHKLIDLANERGGSDNITVQIIKILNGKRKSLIKVTKKQVLNGFLYSLAGLILLFLTYFLFNHFNDKAINNKKLNIIIDTTSKPMINTENEDSTFKKLENDNKKIKMLDSSGIRKE